MKSIKKMTLLELAAFTCTLLNNNDIKCVLSGGACVSIYTQNKYLSYDLDFIENVPAPRIILKNILASAGFKEENRYFKHPDTEFYIEFPSGPLSIGSEPVTKINEIKTGTGVLRLLTPTDSVKDRLAAFYFWDDRQALEQAVKVANDNVIDLKEIRRWSIVENELDKFEKIKKRLKKK
jgi:hypothetical protein